MIIFYFFFFFISYFSHNIFFVKEISNESRRIEKNLFTVNIISLAYLKNIFYWNSNYKTSSPLNFYFSKLSSVSKQNHPKNFEARDTVTNRARKIPPIPSVLTRNRFPNCSSNSPSRGMQQRWYKLFEGNSSMGKKNRDTINPEKHSRFVQPGPRSFQVTFYPETLLPPPPPSLPSPPVETLAPWAETMKILVMPRSPLPAPIPL